jgi:hypothetical protein
VRALLRPGHPREQGSDGGHCTPPCRLDPSRKYIFAQFPHGTVPVATFISAHFIHDTVPGGRIFCLIHTGIFHLPIVR